jgi:hypothetical protein
LAESQGRTPIPPLCEPGRPKVGRIPHPLTTPVLLPIDRQKWIPHPQP